MTGAASTFVTMIVPANINKIPMNNNVPIDLKETRCILCRRRELLFSMYRQICVDFVSVTTNGFVAFHDDGRCWISLSSGARLLRVLAPVFVGHECEEYYGYSLNGLIGQGPRIEEPAAKVDVHEHSR
jgi:hypothetical protein